MKPFIIEHWREDELLEAFNTSDVTISVRGKVMVIKFLPGLIELATDDEIRFDLELLNEYTRAKSKKSRETKTILRPSS